jgi:phosphohistidine swiveling domain-containing protein
VNVLRKAMAAEVEALKPLLDCAYASILHFQRDRTRENEQSMRAAMEGAIERLMIFRPLLPPYKQNDFNVLESQWRTLSAHDMVMLFDHCISIMHVRLERTRSANEAQQPWSDELLDLLQRRGETPTVPAMAGEFLCSGIAASGGRAWGPARVAREPRDLAALQPGDILVCRSTRPDLVPYFAEISALVTDEGGALSHAAIIARERGLPCVTGCRDATVKIESGTEVQVDGDLGLVMATTREAHDV